MLNPPGQESLHVPTYAIYMYISETFTTGSVLLWKLRRPARQVFTPPVCSAAEYFTMCALIGQTRRILNQSICVSCSPVKARERRRPTAASPFGLFAWAALSRAASMAE